MTKKLQILSDIRNELYEVRVNHKWQNLQKAIILSSQLPDVINDVQYLKIYIRGWTNFLITVNRIIKPILISNNLSSKIKLKKRIDLKTHFGLYMLFNGFELELTSNSDGLSHSEWVSITNQMKFAFESEGIKTRNKFKGLIDEISLSDPIDQTWQGFLLLDPHNAIYLLECVQDEKLADRLFQYVIKNKAEIRLLSSDETCKFIYTKLALISKNNWKDFDLLDYEIEHHRLPVVNKFDSVCKTFISHVEKPGLISYYASQQKNNLPGTYELLQNCVASNNGRIFIGGKPLFFEKSDDPKLDFVAGRWTNEFGSVADLNRIYAQKLNVTKEVDEAIFLCSRADGNWFHWLIETLPRIQLLPDNLAPDIPIIISDRLSENARESLEALKDNPVLILPNGESIAVKKLHVVGPTIFHPDTSDYPIDKNTIVNYEILVKFRELVFQRYKISPIKKYRIFLIRKSNVRQPRFQSLAAFIFKFILGYRVVDPSKLTFKEQVELFAGAEKVVSAGGAVMSNFIFLPDEAEIFLFIAEVLMDFTMPVVLADVSKSTVLSITGKRIKNLSRIPTKQHLNHSNFKINILLILKNLKIFK